MRNNTLFSNTDWKELRRRLNNLRAFCFPPKELINPSVQFKFKSDFDKLDVLEGGSGSYPIFPSELKYYWEDRRTLRDGYLDYICVDKKKWFYNTNAKVGDFFLQDGSRKVSFEFPYWMDMSRVIKTPGVRTAVFHVLSKCMGDTFPSEETAKACFSKDLCREIYFKNPFREPIEMAVLEILEPLRQKTQDYLNKNHLADIAASIGFKRYAKGRTFPPNTPVAQQVREYLDGEKRAMYLLGERFGVIKNAERIFRYEEIRDHVRHPNTVRKRILKPGEIYEDFCVALGEPFVPYCRAKNWGRFSDNTEIVNRLSCLSFIWDILNQHVDPALRRKKNKEAYYTDLHQKGLLTEDEIQAIRSCRLNCNAVAHVNTSVKGARKKVLDDTRLHDLVAAISDRHINIIRNWINGNSHS